MTGDLSGSTGTQPKADARISFDTAFIGGSLAIAAMLFVVFLTIKDFFPAAP